jgi:hypothetical protein
VVVVRDGFELDRPGEGELKLELTSGIKVVRSGIAPADGKLDPKITWQGGPGLIRDPGYLLELEVGQGAFVPDQPCQARGSDSRGSADPGGRRWLYAGVGAVLALLAAIILALIRRRNANAPG